MGLLSILDDNKKTLNIKGNEYVFHVISDHVGGLYDLTEVKMPVGGLGVPLHQHYNIDEIFHILDGEVTFQVSEKIFVRGPGSCVIVAAGTLHAWRNESSNPACMTFLHIKHQPSPPFSQYLEGLHRYLSGESIDQIAHAEAHDTYFVGTGYQRGAPLNS